MDAFWESFLLMFVLVNPFIMSVYLQELVSGTSAAYFGRLLFRAGWISCVIYAIFAWAGDSVFEDVLQVSFAAFLIFGGLTFLVVGLRLIFGIGPPVATLKPESGAVSGAIVMPLMVGPGTISASVIAGSRLDLPWAVLAICSAVAAGLGAVMLLKLLHDFVRDRNEKLIARYTETAGRVTALFTGTFAIQMILNGIQRWMATLPT